MSSESAFIIYSNKDSQQAQEFADSLKRAGASVWIDTTNLSDLGEDEDEEEVMENALLSSKLVIILTSKNALNDQFVRNDKRFARENDKKMVLATLEPCDLSKKMRWRNIPVVKLEDDMEDGIQKILTLLNITTAKAEDKSRKEPVPAVSEDESKVSEPSRSEKSGAEMAMLSEIKEDIEYYKFKMKEQISKSRFNTWLGVSIAVVLVALALLIPEVVSTLKSIQGEVQWASTLFGGVLPTTFSVSSFTGLKEKKKRLEGVQLFERKISRMERGIIPVTKAELLALEDDFSLYMNA